MRKFNFLISIITLSFLTLLASCEDSATNKAAIDINTSLTYKEILADTNWVEYEEYLEDSIWTPGAAHRFWMQDSNSKKFQNPPFNTILVTSNETIDSLDNIFNLERKVELDSNQYLFIFDGDEDMRVSTFKLFNNLSSGSVAFVNIITPLSAEEPVYAIQKRYWLNLIINLPINFNGDFHIIKSGETNI